jgi:general secretion pathway protein I
MRMTRRLETGDWRPAGERLGTRGVRLVTGAGRYKSLVSRFQPLDLSLKPLASNLQGFTLLEVLVALAVLAVALVSLLGLQNRNLLLSMQAERLSTGTLLVREMLTRTQLEGPDAARVTSGDFADFHPGQYPEFRWHRTVRPAPLEGLWELRVGVTWGERADEQAELTLFTPLG